jgi:ParB family transcriptional regulator, chromosome partitioning protein
MRKPLGRGLDALIGNTAAENSAENNPAGIGTHLAMVPVGQIKPGKYQPRIYFEEGALAELISAIKSQGVIEPLIVRPVGSDDGDTRYELIAGERRLRAARAAGLEAVPVVIREVDDQAALEMALVENIVRENLSPIEEGIAFKRLNKIFALSHDDIAARVGKSRPYVTNTLRLLELPQEVIELIAGGLLTAGQARPLLAVASPEAQIAAARSIMAGKVTARGAEEIATVHRTMRRSESSADRDVVDPNMSALAESLQRALKRKVRIVRARGKSPGRIEIEFYDENDLNALAETLGEHSRARASAHA